jgi:hypothetical protein
VIDVVATQRIGESAIFGICGLECKLKQMIDDEAKNQEPTVNHCSRSDGRGLRSPDRVSFRLSPPIFYRQLNRRYDVSHYRCEQHDPHNPEKWPGRTQKLGVPVGVILPKIHLKIAEQMPDNEQDQNHSGHGDGNFLADGGLVKCSDWIAREPPRRSGGNRRRRHNLHVIRKTNNCQLGNTINDVTAERSYFHVCLSFVLCFFFRVKFAVRGLRRVRILAFLLLASCVQRDRIHRVVVSVADQAMDVYARDQRVSHYLVSTSKFGIGDGSGTYRTPLGRLEVAKKIGAGALVGAVFKNRKPTGEVLVPNAPGRDPIVTRILWLKGLERQNVDAFDRYIYIHGTPEERNIGRPASFGCIRMRSEDIVRLFATIGVGARVEIVPGPLQEQTPPTPTIAAGSLGSHTQ